MKRIKEFFVKLFGCKTPKEVVVEPLVVKEHTCVEDVKEVVEEASPEADPGKVLAEEVTPVVKKPKRKYYGKPKAAAVKK